MGLQLDDLHQQGHLTTNQSGFQILGTLRNALDHPTTHQIKPPLAPETFFGNSTWIGENKVTTAYRELAGQLPQRVQVALAAIAWIDCVGSSWGLRKNNVGQLTHLSRVIIIK